MPKVVLASSPDAEDFLDDECKDGKIGRATVGVFDSRDGNCLSVVPFNETVGTMMSIGDRHVIGFYKHPKLIDVYTGEVLRRWENLNTGLQDSSIIWGLDDPVPPIATDPINRRFAVADEEKITVVTFN